MKTAPVSALLICFSLATATAEDKPVKIDKIDKATIEKGKEMLEKAFGEVKDAADKSHDQGKTLWPRSKENLRLNREEYLKKVVSGLATMDAEIQALRESEAALISRDYFKTRIEALKQHLDYCRRDLERLTATATEEAFRVKQKGFDRGLGYLGDNIELAQEEAGL